MHSTSRRALNAKRLPRLRGKTSQRSPGREKVALIRCLGPRMETRTQWGVLKTGKVEQASRVMYISHIWTATYLQLREPQSKDGRKRGKAAKRSLRGLQCPALECPRQTLAGQTAIHGRTVDFD